MSNEKTAQVVAPGPSRALHIALWVVQGLLALLFTMTGLAKLSQPIADLAAQMVWPGAVPEPLVRFVGASEFAGALGLVLPAVTRVQPRLTPLAAAGLATVMGLAMIFHVSRGELGLLPINLLLGGLATFVAWGRWRAAPIAPR